MSTPYQVGQLSPDGMWRWDGTQWVPTGQAGPPPRRGSHRWIWWLAGGCALLLVLGVAGGIWGITSFVHSLQSGGLSCLPSDFPKYPSATVTRDFTYVGTGLAPGDSRECQETLDTNDDSSTVTQFYVSKLNAGDWKITSTDSANGQIRLQRVSRPQTVGIIQLLGRGEHTTIQIRLDS